MGDRPGVRRRLGAGDRVGFIDNISGHLRAGRLLLLVIGDGNQSSLEIVADLLSRHPTLGFHQLVELRLFDTPDGDRLVVPTLVGRSQEVVRAVISINHPDDVTVSVAAETPATTSRKSTIDSLDEFVLRASEEIDATRAHAIADVALWWEHELGGFIRFGKSSIALWAQPSQGKGASVVILYVDGTAEGSAGSLARTRRFVERDVALEGYEAAGFTGDSD